MTPEQLKQARQSLGLTQPALAQILGFDRSHISRMENGSAPIARTTEIAVKALLAGLEW